jgi:MFS superfamily sulfate permease-like transporter
MPSAGGMSQTVVNNEAGARTQVAQLVTCAAVTVTVLFLTSAVALMPYATLAAVVVVATLGMVSPKEFRAILRIRRREFWWAVVTLVAVILLGTMNGIAVAVVVSMLTLLHQANHPPVYAVGRKPGTDVFRPLSAEHADDETFPGLLMIRTEGRLHFASAPNIGETFTRLIEEARPRVVALDLSAVPDIEYTALKMLTEAEERLREAGVELWLAALNPAVLEAVGRAPLGQTLGHERMFFNLEQAVEAYQQRTSSSFAPE